MSEIDDPLERFVAVIRFYLSGWHIKPPYVQTQRLEEKKKKDDADGHVGA